MSGGAPTRMYLVTGGCGFIGSHLCDALLARGQAVRVLDDFSTGKRENLAAGAELRVGDVADAATVRDAMDGVAGCFHLAAIASVQRCMEDWLGTHRVNLGGAIAVLDAARASRAPVVYASSAAVYGDCRTLPIGEGSERRPLSAYGADKLGCELHAQVASHAFGVPATGLRFFNVYGPRQDPASPYSGVISIFCERLRRGAPVEVFGDGGQTRDFIDVRDVVAALLAAMDRAPAASAAYNVCTGVPTSVRDLADTIADLRGATAEIRPRPARAGEIRHSVGDPSLATRELGLAAPRLLREGLGDVLAWMDRAG